MEGERELTVGVGVRVCLQVRVCDVGEERELQVGMRLGSGQQHLPHAHHSQSVSRL